MFNTLTCHYTATYDTQDIGAREIDLMHRARGWSGIGYHWVIRLDGTVEIGRSEGKVGAHVAGRNTGNLGVVTVGGLRRTSGPSVGIDTRTDRQKAAQIALIRQKLTQYPTINKVVGHNELAATLCPAYKVNQWWKSLSGEVPEPAPMDSQSSGLPIRTRPLLHYGNKRKEVVALQDALKRLGFFPAASKSTGYFGEVTLKSVRAFQEHAKIVVDGMVGNATWTAIILRGGFA